MDPPAYGRPHDQALRRGQRDRELVLSVPHRHGQPARRPPKPRGARAPARRRGLRRARLLRLARCRHRQLERSRGLPRAPARVARSAQPRDGLSAARHRRTPLRLGIYSDMRYRADVNGVSSHHSFLRFLANLPPRVEELVFFGRPDPEPGRSPYELPPPSVRFVPLLDYNRGTPLGPPLRSLRRAGRVLPRRLDRIDALWAFGPDPIAPALALMARRRGTPVVLGA